MANTVNVCSEGVCHDCGNNLVLDRRHGELVCSKCGLVAEESIFDSGPEWRAFDEDQRSKRARTGGMIKYSKMNKGLTTEIDRYDRDIRGNNIPAESKAKMFRMRRWQRRSRMSDSVQRNLSTALPTLDRICSYLNLPDNIKEESAKLYRKAVDEGLIRGRSIESVVSATVYLVSRRNQLAKTLEELEDVSSIPKKDIGKAYRFLCRRLNIKMPVLTPVSYLSRIASKLKVSGETEAKAREILEKASEKGLTSGREPYNTAAAALKLAGELTKNKSLGINKIDGITELTVQARYKELANFVKTKLATPLPVPA